MHHHASSCIIMHHHDTMNYLFCFSRIFCFFAMTWLTWRNASATPTSRSALAAGRQYDSTTACSSPFDLPQDYKEYQGYSKDHLAVLFDRVHEPSVLGSTTIYIGHCKLFSEHETLLRVVMSYFILLSTTLYVELYSL